MLRMRSSFIVRLATLCVLLLPLGGARAATEPAAALAKQTAPTRTGELSLAARYGAVEPHEGPLDSIFIQMAGPSAAPERSPLYVNVSQLRLTRYTAREGAPSVIYGLSQTADGTLWISSSTGLWRFDGTEFDSKVGDSLPDPTIHTVFAGKHGELWLGFTFGGVGRLDRGAFTAYPEASFPSGSVKEFAAGNGGSLYALSTTGVAQLSGMTWRTLTAADGYPGQAPRWIGNYGGKVWIVDNEGVYGRLSPGAPFQQTPGGIPEVGDSPVPYRVLSSSGNDYLQQHKLVDSSGAVWFSTSTGFKRYRWLVNTSPWQRTAPEQVSEGFIDSPGLMMADREGNIWLATARDLLEYTPTKFTPQELPVGTTWPVFAIAPDNTLWLGGEKPGAVRPGRSFEAVPQLGDHVGCIGFDDMGNMWTVATDAVRRISGDAIGHYPAQANEEWGRNCQGIAISPKLGVWISVAKAGIFQLSDGKWVSPGATRGLPKGAAVRVVNDDQGRIWLTYPKDRIAVLDGDRTTIFTGSDGLAVGNVLGLYVHGETVWAAGDVGIARLVRDRFIPLKGADGQAFRGTSGIVETPGGELWLNSVSGVYRIGKDELRRAAENPGYEVVSEHFDDRDGVRSQASQLRPGPSVRLGPDGTLWVAGQTSLSSIHPDHILRNRVAPEVSIRNVIAGTTTYTALSNLELPIHTRAVSIRYTAAMLTSPDRVAFRYRLTGSDGEWHNVGQRRTAYFTNLDPGTYRFEVTAANEDGVPASRPAFIDFSIRPAFYQTWWFTALSVLGLIVLCLVLLRVHLQRSTNKVRVLLNERQSERDRIARDLHDTLLQDFQGISLHLQAWTENPQVPDSVREQISRTASHAVTSLKYGRQIILLLRGETGKQISFIDAIEACASHSVVGTPTSFAMSVAGAPRPLTVAAQEEVLAIVRECVRNGVTHASATSVKVHVRYRRFSLVVTVADDGRGFASSDRLDQTSNDRWGLVGMLERARLIGARLTLTRAREGGTIARLKIPSWRAYAKRAK